MAIDFPNSPSVNDTFTADNRTWIWNGTTWDAVTDEVLSVDAPITFNSSTRTVGLDQAGIQNGHNYIINGAFDIWQRGSSFTGINGTYTADRFMGNAGVNVSRGSFSAGELDAASTARYYFTYTPDGAGTNRGLQTRLEDLRMFSGKTLTGSFWAKASSAKNVRMSLGLFYGNSSTEYLDSSTLTLGTTWQRYTYTWNVPSFAGKTFGTNYLIMYLVDNDANTIQTDVWGMQLEAGSVATPFKRHAPSLALEKVACQRYYWRTNNPTNIAYQWFLNADYRDPDQVAGVLHLPVEMRTAPTVSSSGAFMFYQKTTIFASNTGPNRLDANTTSIGINLGGLTSSPAEFPGGAIRSNNDPNAYIEAYAEL